MEAPSARRPNGPDFAMAPTPRTQLIVNADDFGLCRPVNEGIITAHRHGIVTATSLMAVGRAFEHAVGACRQAPGLDIGIHLTLVGEKPLLQRRTSLADSTGSFPASALALVRAYGCGAIRRPDVRAEWTAQIEKILDAGLCPSHIDSHQHVHVLPGLTDIVMDLAAAYRIAFVRRPIERLQASLFKENRAVPRLLGWTTLAACWSVSRAFGAVSAPPWAPRFLGFFHSGRLDAHRLGQLLCSLRPGTVYELMCHPGYAPQEPTYQRWGYGHDSERNALTTPGIRERLSQLGIHLIGFVDLMP